MSKPPKFDLKALIAGDVASSMTDTADTSVAPAPMPAPVAVAEPDVKPTAPVVALKPAKEVGEGTKAKGTLKQRAKQQSLYLEQPVYERLREIAFHERKAMHELFLEGIEAVLKKRGAPSIKALLQKAS